MIDKDIKGRVFYKVRITPNSKTEVRNVASENSWRRDNSPHSVEKEVIVADGFKVEIFPVDMDWDKFSDAVEALEKGNSSMPYTLTRGMGPAMRGSVDSFIADLDMSRNELEFYMSDRHEIFDGIIDISHNNKYDKYGYYKMSYNIEYELTEAFKNLW